MKKMTYTLPELSGTEKQVAWATKIRKRQYSLLNTYVLNNVQKKPEQADLWVNAFNWIFGREDAKYWIDRRDAEPSDVIREAHRANLAAGLTA